MASVVVDGVRMPVLVSGHPALDFCNTLVGWGEPDLVDALVSYEALVRFTAYLGLLGTAQVDQLLATADVSRATASQVLRRARELRGATYDIVTSAAGPRQWSVVRRAVGSAAAAGVLEEGRNRWAAGPTTCVRRVWPRRCTCLPGRSRTCSPPSPRHEWAAAPADSAAGSSSTGATGAGASWPPAATGRKRVGTPQPLDAPQADRGRRRRVGRGR